MTIGFLRDIQGIFALRDQAAVARVRATAGEPFGGWRQSVDSGAELSSWRVRRRIEAQGANGLIDPSRQRGNLCHCGTVDPGTSRRLSRCDKYCAPANAGAQGSTRNACGPGFLRAQEHGSLFDRKKRQTSSGDDE